MTSKKAFKNFYANIQLRKNGVFEKSITENSNYNGSLKIVAKSHINNIYGSSRIYTEMFIRLHTGEIKYRFNIGGN